MPDDITQSSLRAQVERHLLMVEEVLGGMDQFLMNLESRVTRIEDSLGMHSPEGSSPTLADDVQRLKADLSRLLGR